MFSFQSELWKTDGTVVGTTLIKDINPTGESRPFDLISNSEVTFFFADDGTNGREPWKTDGTEEGTVLIKDINPTLTPKEIKMILMGTVDKKSFLSSKVKSSGIVNTLRATRAAKLTLRMPVRMAISGARVSVKDVKTSNLKSTTFPFGIKPLSLIPTFK